MLAKQYKSMYPTLEMDVDGELEKLKVTSSEGNAERNRGGDVFCVGFRATRRRSSPW